MQLTELLARIAPEWQAEYAGFVDTGNASDELLAYLDSHQDCEQLIAFVFADPLEQSAQSAPQDAFRPVLKSASH